MKTLVLQASAQTVVMEVRRLLTEIQPPILVAIDGGSGCGKSTMTNLIAEELGAALIPGDDFFAAQISEAQWDACTSEQKAADCIDWKQMRADVLEPLLAGKPARWYAFDFVAGVRPDGTYGMQTDYTECKPASVIVLDGSYSTRPELSDLIHLSVLVDVPVSVRHQRLAAREDKDFLEAWHKRWDDAEEYYFTHVRPPASFDLVVTNMGMAENDSKP